MVQVYPHFLQITEHLSKLIDDLDTEPVVSATTSSNSSALHALDINQIQDGILLISVPLTAGNYEFPGLFKPAQVHIGADTTSWLSVKLNTNPKGKICISQLTITLSKDVVVCNPSTAYEKDGNGFRDLFASVHISGIDIDSDGRVLFQGYMRKGFSTNDIKEDFKPEMFPKIQLELESLLKPQKDKDSETDYNSIHDILVKLGAVLGEAKCSLKCTTTKGKAELHTKITFDSKGLMTLVSDPEYSSGFITSNNHIGFSPNLKISGVNMLKPKVSGSLDVNAQIGKLARFDSRIQLQKNKPSSIEASLELLLAQPELAAKFQIVTSSLREGEVSYTLHPSAFNVLSRSLKYKFFSGGKLAIKPSSSGLAQFLCPETQFVVRPEKLLSGSTAAVGSLREPEWFQKAEELGGSPIRSGNKAKLLIDGVQSFPERLRLIREAKESICLQTLIFRDDDCGMETAKALIEAKNRGVCVYVIIDGFGNIDSIDDLLRENKAFKLMRNNGIEIQTYSSSAFLGLQKIVPIAKKYGLLEKINHLSDLFGSGQITSTLNLFARLSIGSLDLGMTQADRKIISEGLDLILNKTELNIEKIAAASQESPLGTDDIFKILSGSISINQRWHEKYLIIDGSQAIVGGMNIASEYFLGGMNTNVAVMGVSRPAWRDTDILLEGPASGDAYRHFANNWLTLTGQKLETPTPKPQVDNPIEIQMLHSKPGLEPFHSITNFKIEAINRLQAGDKLYEASAYFIPVGALTPFVDALKKAAARGVDVRILTNGIQGTDLPQLNRAAMATSYRDLLAGGVRIFERVGTQTMHQKVSCYGSQVSMVGSYNLDNRSASLNSESVAVVHNEAFTRQVEDMILSDLQPGNAKEIFLANVESLPISEELQNSAWAMLAELM